MSVSSRRAGRWPARSRRRMASSSVTICRRGTEAKPGSHCRPASAASACPGVRGLGQRQDDADARAFTPHRALEVADHAASHILPGLDADDPHSGLAETEPPDRPPVGALLARVPGLGGDQRQGRFREPVSLPPRFRVAGAPDLAGGCRGLRRPGPGGASRGRFSIRPMARRVTSIPIHPARASPPHAGWCGGRRTGRARYRWGQCGSTLARRRPALMRR